MLPKLEFQGEIFRDEFAGKGLWLPIEVENVESEYERIKNSEVKIAVELRTEEWGETHFSVVDPNNIGIDFVLYKAAEETANN